MYKFLFIFLASVILFCLQFVVFNLAGNLAQPSLLVLLIIFVNIFFGLPQSLTLAVFAGVLSDSFETYFGFNIIAYVAAALLTSFLRRFVYERGSRASLLWLTFLVMVCVITIRFLFLQSMQTKFVWSHLQGILINDLMVTMLIAKYIYDVLIKCASKLYAP